ncbi:MAG TPA: LLM class flavin-dependent oxidoreductase [Solirubrobacteraceae bacterium]|jgi:alkanesulfonate monooxygenase SsuD/methylene tetrahydromethanopterin reductase-like flavin-dependent oxidoreductase (luciferase family)|nr:LLM class flavin-dependent oxidoreductase [Solirubrobacteraceae bacterium]
MKRSIVFGSDELEPLVPLAQRAEAAGFSRVWTTEYVGRDAIARAIAVALATEKIEVGTGIAYAFTRSPLAMAALAADVQRLSNGRFALGLGSGTRGVRRWYGVENFSPAGTAMERYAEAVRAGIDLEHPPTLHAAALNPTMGRLAARAYDGVLLHPIALARVHLRERLLPAVRRGSEQAQVAAWVITSIADDAAEAVHAAKSQIAFYLSTPSYASVVQGTPWEHVAGDVREAYDASERKAPWTELASLVPDEVVAELALAGTPAQVREQFEALERELAGDGIAELVLQPPIEGFEQACGRIIDHLATGVRT